MGQQQTKNLRRGRPPLMANTRSTSVNVRLPEPIFDALYALARARHTTVRAIVREAVNIALKNSPSLPSAPQ